MDKKEDNDRYVATCEDCGSVYVALKTEDGDLHLVGLEPVCQNCGGEQFKLVNTGDQPLKHPTIDETDSPPLEGR